LSPSEETPKVQPVKFGEHPGSRKDPSQRRAKPRAAGFVGRCREQTAGTYGHKLRWRRAPDHKQQ